MVTVLIGGETMSTHVTVSGAARELGARLGLIVRPRDISDLLYDRVVPDDRCPMLGGRRMIPIEYLAELGEALIERRGRRRREAAR